MNLLFKKIKNNSIDNIIPSFLSGPDKDPARKYLSKYLSIDLLNDDDEDIEINLHDNNDDNLNIFDNTINNENENNNDSDELFKFLDDLNNNDKDEKNDVNDDIDNDELLKDIDNIINNDKDNDSDEDNEKINLDGLNKKLNDEDNEVLDMTGLKTKLKRKRSNDNQYSLNKESPTNKSKNDVLSPEVINLLKEMDEIPSLQKLFNMYNEQPLYQFKK